MKRPRFFFATLFVCAVSFSLTAMGQLPVPSLSSVYPSGGKAGTATEVSISGADLDDAHQLVFSHAGIVAKQKTSPPSEFEKTPLPVANSFAVQIGKDVPAGTYEVRAVGRFGVSTPRMFAVGHLEEVSDNGNNRTPSSAQEIKVPSIVNGRVEASNRDYYKLSLSKGERVIVECIAERLDSRLDSVMILYDQNGSELSRSRNSIGADALVDFTAPVQGSYLVAIHDAIYGGSADYFYRLKFHRGTHVDFVLPAAGMPGSNDSYKVYGRNLPNGKPAPNMFVDGAQLQVVDMKFALPKDRNTNLESFVRGSGALVETAMVRVGDASFPIGLALQKPVLEKEGNNEAGKAQKITVPCEFMGQFYPARDADWVEFEAKKGQIFWIDVYSHRLGLESDPTIYIYQVSKDKEGKETSKLITQADDPGDRNGRIGSDFDTSTDDPSYRMAVPADGIYRIKVRDQFGDGRSDPRSVYRMSIRPEEPSFKLVALSRQIKVANNNQVLPYAVALRQGSTRLLEMRIERKDGFSGEVTISAEGLPAGVTCAPAMVMGNVSTTYLVFEAAENAKPWVGSVKIVGKATINGKKFQTVARGLSVTWSTANRTQTPALFRATYGVYLSVGDQEKGPALAKIEDKMWETSKGGKLEIPVNLTRRGADADLKFTAVGAAAEIKPADVTIKKGAKDGKVTMTITNAKAKAGVYTFFMRSDTKFKYSRNPDLAKRAEARQKIIADAMKALAAELKTVTTDRDAKNKAAQTATAAHVQGQNKEKALVTAQANADKANAAAQNALAAANKAVAGKPDDAGLKAKQAAAQKVGTAAKQAADKAKAGLDAHRKEVAKLKATLDAANAAKTAAEAKVKAATDKNSRATALKKTLDKQVAAAKKANAAKDINIAVISTPIRVRIADTPLKLTLDKPALEVKQNAKVQLPVKLARMYGFNDAVSVTIRPAKNLKGLTGKLQIAKGQPGGNLEIAAAATATPGEHTIPIVAEATFNKVKVQATGQLKLKIVAEPKKKK